MMQHDRTLHITLSGKRRFWLGPRKKYNLKVRICGYPVLGRGTVYFIGDPQQLFAPIAYPDYDWVIGSIDSIRVREGLKAVLGRRISGLVEDEAFDKLALEVQMVDHNTFIEHDKWMKLFYPPSGKSNLVSVTKRLPGVNAYAAHPVDSLGGGKASVWTIIQDLNDNHHWTRAQIADWLETLDIDFRFETTGENSSVS